MNINDPKCETVVFVGGGFGGLTAALSLSRLPNCPKIFLIEPKTNFVFLPLLYEFLSEEIKFWEVASDYRSLINNKGIVLINEFAKSINTELMHVITESGLKIEYSKLVISTGSKPAFFGVSGAKENSHKFNSIDDVKEIRKLIRNAMLSDQENKELIIVGAGSAGVELACKIADMSNNKIKINLIEKGSRILPNNKSFNREQSLISLKKRNIRIYLETEVCNIYDTHIVLTSKSNLENIEFELPHLGCIWTAGQQPMLPEIYPSIELIKGRLPVDQNLNVVEVDNVMAIGDVAIYEAMPYPSTAQVAMQQGHFIAKNFYSSLRGHENEPFVFNDLGEMMSLGIGGSTITALGLTLSGPLAFQIRRLAYLMRMPNFSIALKSAISLFVQIGKLEKNEI